MREVSIGDFLETLEDMVLVVNREGRILYSNNAVTKILGYTQQELVDMQFFAALPKDTVDEIMKIFNDMFAGKRESYTTSLVRKDGTLLTAKTRVWQGKWNSEQCLFGIIKDLSKEQDNTNSLPLDTCGINADGSPAWSEKCIPKKDIVMGQKDKDKDSSKARVLIVDDQLFNLKLLESALKEDYIVMTASNGREAIELATGKTQPDIILLDVVMPEMDGYEVCIRLREMPETKDIPIMLLTALKNEENEEYALELGAVDYITKPFSIPIIKGRIKNHVEQKKNRDRQKENSYIDELTQIANRRKFNEYVAIEWNRARRNGSYLSVLMIDVDLFKKYNDYYGHLEGDKSLYKIAQALKLNLKRSADLAARWGGEEFACILTDTDRIGAILVGERLRKAIVKLEIPSKVSDVASVVTVSVGVATMLPSEDNSLEELLEKADTAVYKAKRTGRNRVCAV